MYKESPRCFYLGCVLVSNCFWQPEGQSGGLTFRYNALSWQCFHTHFLHVLNSFFLLSYLCFNNLFSGKSMLEITCLVILWHKLAICTKMILRIWTEHNFLCWILFFFHEIRCVHLYPLHWHKPHLILQLSALILKCSACTNIFSAENHPWYCQSSPRSFLIPPLLSCTRFDISSLPHY